MMKIVRSWGVGTTGPIGPNVIVVARKTKSANARVNQKANPKMLCKYVSNTT